MVGSELKEAGGRVIERHCRVTLDLKVLISEITLDVLRRRWKWDDPAQIRESGGRQNRLLRALLGNEDVLGRFLAYVVVNDLELKLDVELQKGYEVGEAEEILEPVYTAMGEEDARFFREVKEEGIFFDNTVQFEGCFSVEWEGTRLVEIKQEREEERPSAEQGAS